MRVTREIPAIVLSVLLVCPPVMAQEEKPLGMETNTEYEMGLKDGEHQ